MQNMARLQAARELGGAVVALSAATAISLLLVSFTGYVAVALLYLLLVVASGLHCSRVTVLFTATVSALLWDFLFIPPHFTFYIATIEDSMLFAMFFVVALAMGQLTSQLRSVRFIEQQRERRTDALYELLRRAGLAHDLDAGLRAALSLIEKLFELPATLYLRRADHSLAHEPHFASKGVINDKQFEVAQYAFLRGISAGKFTQVMADAEVCCLPLKGITAVMGVLAIRPEPKRAFALAERELIETFAVLIGTILEREHLLAAVKHAEVVEASERLRRALLHSVSHELKTPLAAVQTGVEALAGTGEVDPKRAAAAHEVRSALRRLHRVIDNLLSMSRIESGVVQAQLDWCDIGEMIEAARDLAGDNLTDHKITIQRDEHLPMVKVDQALLEQCLCNLLLNATAWSPPSSTITIAAILSARDLVLTVLDQGEGIPAEELARIFNPFYRTTRAKPGGTGLGLAIVDGFVRAHGGKVEAANREVKGCKFTITIPVETLPIHLMEKLH
jgi:two-component system sensor histidine kinase KdpD